MALRRVVGQQEYYMKQQRTEVRNEHEGDGSRGREWETDEPFEDKYAVLGRRFNGRR